MYDVGKTVCITHQLVLSIYVYIRKLVAHFQRIYINNAFRSFCEEDYMHKETCSLEIYKRHSLFLCWISLENQVVELFSFLFIKYIFTIVLCMLTKVPIPLLIGWVLTNFYQGERNNRGVCLVLFEKYCSVEF